MESSKKLRKTATSHFREIIVYLRVASGWSQKRMADEIGVSQSQVNLVECGKRNITQNLLDKICVRFNITIEEFVGCREAAEAFYAGKQIRPKHLIKLPPVLNAKQKEKAKYHRPVTCPRCETTHYVLEEEYTNRLMFCSECRKIATENI